MEKGHSFSVLLLCLILLLPAPPRPRRDPPASPGNPASAPILLGMIHLFSEV